MDKEKEHQLMMTAIMKEFNYQPPMNLEKICEGLVHQGYGNVEQYQQEIERLHTELAHREEDLVHADENVFYREEAVKLDEDKIKKQAVKEFAEKLKENFLKGGISQGCYDGYSIRKIIDNLITELYGADEL